MKRAPKLKAVAWMIAGLFVAAGISQAAPPKALPVTLPADPDPAPAPKPKAKPAPVEPVPTFDNLEVVDTALNAKLTVLRVGSAMGENNVLTVFAGLKNKTDRKLVLEVETIYKDKAGNELNTGSWIRVTLKPHEQNDYRSASISDQATDFLIRVRKPSTATATAKE